MTGAAHGTLGHLVDRCESLVRAILVEGLSFRLLARRTGGTGLATRRRRCGEHCTGRAAKSGCGDRWIKISWAGRQWLPEAGGWVRCRTLRRPNQTKAQSMDLQQRLTREMVGVGRCHTAACVRDTAHSPCRDRVGRSMVTSTSSPHRVPTSTLSITMCRAPTPIALS